jgi:sugar fermentation stimulation protein A
LLPGRFIARPNRFVAHLQLDEPRDDAGVVTAHVPDPGRLKELLVPGGPVWVQDHGAASSAYRKHRYTLQLVASPETRDLTDDAQQTWVSVDTQRPNQLVGQWLAEGSLQQVLTPLQGYTLLQREFTPNLSPFESDRQEATAHRSRFDFLLASPVGSPCFMEVKSVSLREGKAALFPDAPTARGTRHLLALTQVVKQGGQACVLFVVQREDCEVVQANHQTDPALASALQSAILEGVIVRAIAVRIGPTGCDFLKELPVVFPQAV